jgi:hypothetical protein
MSDPIKTDFERHPWHDAVLLSLAVIRAEPGVRDEVELRIEWGDGRRQDAP